MSNIQQAKEQLEKLIELFSSKELTSDYSKVFIHTQGKPCQKWTFTNKMLMYVQGTTDARGFNQWKSVGRYINKGSKAIYILAPRFIKVKKVDEITHLENEVTILDGFLGIPIFRYEDTNGKDLEVYKPKELPPLMDVAKAWNLKVRYDDTNFGEYGSFNPKTDEIVLSTEDISTFFHELAHKAHSKIEPLKAGQDIEQEIIAELSACVLAQLYNHNVADKTYTYIASYIENKNPMAIARACMRVFNKVEKILNLILEAQEKYSCELIIQYVNEVKAQ